MIFPASALPALESQHLSLFFANEHLFDDLPVLIFHGPSITANLTQNTSRIQAHVYCLAGFYSFPRLTVAPTSSLYAAVNHLPSDLQGDELYRGLAIALLSCFAAIPEAAKSAIRDLANNRVSNGVAPAMFDEMHAADLASNMIQINRISEIKQFLCSALRATKTSWIDMDVLLPTRSIHRATNPENGEPLLENNGLPLLDYGDFTPVIECFGTSAFLPTTKLQRAPSRTAVHSKAKTMSNEDKVSLRREMWELSNTESSYLNKLRNLLKVIVPNTSQHTAQEAW